MNNNKNIQINVLMVDDHQMFIDGMKSLLKKEKNIQIVAEALNGKQAIEIINNQHIDLAIVDISMPEMSGTELIKIIKKDFPYIKILVVTMYNDKGIINEIINSEAEGYILKNSGKQELINAIHQITDNGTYYCSEVVSILINTIKKTEIKSEEKVKNLTEREIEIINLICKEYSSAQIAEELFISQFTVDTHRKNILKKTNSKTLVGLIKYSIINNLIK